MTDKNIIKAAEYCLEVRCEDCPYNRIEYEGTCSEKLDYDEVELLKDQRAELEEVGKKLMRSELEKEMLHRTIEEIKLEVIKEFMDRLKEKKKRSHLNEGIVTMDIIESIIEEMIGEIQ